MKPRLYESNFTDQYKNIYHIIKFYFNLLSAGAIHMWHRNLDITLLADVLIPNSARPSAGIVLMTKGRHIFFQFSLYSNDIISSLLTRWCGSNGWKHFTKSSGSSSINSFRLVRLDCCNAPNHHFMSNFIKANKTNFQQHFNWILICTILSIKISTGFNNGMVIKTKHEPLSVINYLPQYWV